MVGVSILSVGSCPPRLAPMANSSCETPVSASRTLRTRSRSSGLGGDTPFAVVVSDCCRQPAEVGVHVAVRAHRVTWRAPVAGLACRQPGQQPPTGSIELLHVAVGERTQERPERRRRTDPAEQLAACRRGAADRGHRWNRHRRASRPGHLSPSRPGRRGHAQPAEQVVQTSRLRQPQHGDQTRRRVGYLAAGNWKAAAVASIGLFTAGVGGAAMKVIRTGYKSRAIRALAWSHINVSRSSFGYVTQSHVTQYQGRWNWGSRHRILRHYTRLSTWWR